MEFLDRWLNGETHWFGCSISPCRCLAEKRDGARQITKLQHALAILQDRSIVERLRRTHPLVLVIVVCRDSADAEARAPIVERSAMIDHKEIKLYSVLVLTISAMLGINSLCRGFVKFVSFCLQLEY